MENFKPDICIIGGCGHVGLPLGLSFTHIGKRVLLLDIDETKIKQVQSGTMPFKEEGAESLLKESLQSNRLLCTSSPEKLSLASYIIIVTGTPLDEYLNPRLDAITKVLDHYFPYFRDDQILVLRSTIYPSISQKIHDYFQKREKKIHVTFCPERVIEGEALKEFSSLPQIVSGFTPVGLEKVKELFSLLTPKLIEMLPLEAELVKLFANAYRYIHFSIANQFYMIAASHQVDFYKLYHAMIEDYPRMKNFPKPGLTAGPCLLKDTMQLSAFANHHFYLGHAAMLVNENLPRFMVDHLKLNTSLSDKTVGILGMAFKAESDDRRDSLSYKLKKILKLEADTVLCSDEYIQEEDFVSKEELIERSDIIIIGTPHKKYRDLKLRDRKVLDIWNILQN